jgi:multiple sugar transport system permease protein
MARSAPQAGAVAPAARARRERAEGGESALQRWLRQKGFALALIAPTLVILFALTIFPFVYAVYVSLFDFYLPRPQQSSFVGLGNFAGVLSDARFWVSMRQTGYFLTSAIAAEFILGMALALFFFEESRGRSLKALYLPLVLVPMMVAPVVIGYMWRLLYQVEFGPINYLLYELFGLGPFEWTASPRSALLSVIIADVWQWTPFVTLVLLAGLVSLPQELFEVAQLDGASYWQRLWHITLPMLRRVIAIALLIRLLDAFRELDKIYVMTQGGPGTATETVSYYAYLSGFKYFQVGYAAAMSILLLLVTVVICTAIAKVLFKEQPGEG